MILENVVRHLVCCFSDSSQKDSSDKPENSENLDLAGPGGWFGRIWQNPWLVFLLPFFVYMIVGQFEPTSSDSSNFLTKWVPYEYYPWIYTLKIALTLVAIMLVWPGYRQFPFKVSWLAVGVGVVGVVLWVGLTKLDIESYLSFFGLTELGKRTAFNPFEVYESSPAAIWSFLGVRFFGLMIVIPIIEEFFLRGFIMRFFIERDWWKVPFGNVTPVAIIAGTVVPMLSHPLTELLAVAVWFSLVTWLMIRTKNIWDCVVAHMVTNGLLGVYVIISGDWYLW